MIKRINQQADMFSDTFEDTPLFSGVPQSISDQTFTPQPVDKQSTMPGFERDWQETAKVIKQKGKGK